MDSQTIFAALRDALAELYPGEVDAQAVVTAAVGRRGLRRAQPSRSRTVEAKPITFSAPVQTNWQQILIAAIALKQRLNSLCQGANKPLP